MQKIWNLICSGMLLLSLFLGTGSRSYALTCGQTSTYAFKRMGQDSRIAPALQYWMNIYTQYSTADLIIHDAKQIDRVYEVVRGVKGGSKNAQILKEKWRKVLLSVHAKQGRLELLNHEEKKVFHLFRSIKEPYKFLRAAHRKRLHVQRGQKENFLDGFRQSGLYLSHMERVFCEENVPQEIARLPFVESSFNLKARSKVGASGIWQFMGSTAALYLPMGPGLDERNDPLLATRAAAQLLKSNYRSLGAWPLAVTAYNHGRKSLMRAVRKEGTSDYPRLLAEHRGRSFGFSSRNFFIQLLAVEKIERNPQHYFKKFKREAPLQFQELKAVGHEGINEGYLDVVLSKRNLDLAVIRSLNPGLDEGVLTSLQPIPAGYSLRIPFQETQRDGQ
jgi:membrane-bound lytic murein transglycosylase D